MSKFIDFAEKWVENNQAGKKPAKAFARMLEDAQRVHVDADIKQLAELYYATTKRNAYVATAGLSGDAARGVAEYAHYIDCTLTRTPQAVADLLDCEWQRMASWDAARVLMKPDRTRLHSYDSAGLNALKRMLHEAAQAGAITETPVKICGRVAVYLYSL